MSIEALAQSLIEALDRNTQALLAQGGKATTAAAPADKGKPAADKGKPAAKKEEAAKPKHTEDEVVAAISKLKDDFNVDEAKAIVKKLGFAKMADITPDKYDEAVELAEKRYEELTEEGGDGL